MSTKFIENMLPITAMALGVMDPPVFRPEFKTWQHKTAKRRLRIWHMDDLPEVHCDIENGTPGERINCITNALAKAMKTAECDRYLLPSLPILAEFWIATPEETYFALKQLKAHGYMVMVPGYNGDVTVTRIAM